MTQYYVTYDLGTLDKTMKEIYGLAIIGVFKIKPTQ